MNNNLLADAPPLFSLTRGTQPHGPIIECVHRGLISVVDGDGQIVFQMGNGTIKTHMRSTAKLFQVMPLLEEGLPDDLSLRDIALFISSHSGEPFHTERVAEILHFFGFDEADLRCGAHAPYHLSTQLDLLKQQKKPTQLHNNCSGKHTAMLLVCQKLKADPAYEKLDHEIQKRIKTIISTFASCDENEIDAGIDGCSMPTFCLPLQSIALAYARLGHWQNNSPYASVLNQIVHAATTYPEYVAGTERFDTELMKAAGSNILSKTGADGMHALSIKPSSRFPKGLGIAIKIVDGDHKQTIRPLVIKEILTRLGEWPADESLDRFLPNFHNFRGQLFGSSLCHF